jgi:hypothetical protein
MKALLGIVCIVSIMTLSQSCSNSKKKSEKNPNIHEVVVKEAIQAGEYTYLRVTEGDAEKWLAAPSCNPVVGTTYYYKGGMEMKDFKSKELNRTFESVYFIDNFSSTPISDSASAVNVVRDNPQGDMAKHIAKTTSEKVNVKIAPAVGGVTIADLYKNKAAYAGKSVKVRGKVTKINAAIMNKNWIHLQDGTEFDNNFDLTVTSLSEVANGDTVIAEGKIGLDKDFGYNYTYKILMEDAVVKKK